VEVAAFLALGGQGSLERIGEALLVEAEYFGHWLQEECLAEGHLWVGV